MEVLEGTKSCHISIFLCSALLLLGVLGPIPAHGRLQIKQKPNPDNAVATARWLVSQNLWGVLSTISSELGGVPFGCRNVVSFSDGLPGEGHGIPYFYLTALDPTARDALKNMSSSLTLSEVPLGSCGKIDPENPTCAKLTLNGKLKLVDVKTPEGKFALSALFAKHAEMKNWPKEHNFQIFKLDIEHIFLIDWFGGPKPLTPYQYFNPGK
ncbi:protein CREG1-like isoform X1 [Dioscorea cayenensis subsp. rotundata]|uniref:Protein CREG1-like isoform X1 n=1 Tax=Dioscorea cayennensis subsp. rotundata TaxID=55577 RepID=A0AB40BUG7_DIOCR|nr:protein CREG1-like isoform X1 [Dioscorea cayenensis subsp. rotundata]